MAAASLQILKSTLFTPVSVSHSNFPGKSDSSGKVRFRSYNCLRGSVGGKFRVCCGVQDGDNNQTNGKSFNVHFIYYFYFIVINASFFNL